MEIHNKIPEDILGFYLVWIDHFKSLFRNYHIIRKRQILMRLDTKLLQPFASWSNSL